MTAARELVELSLQLGGVDGEPARQSEDLEVIHAFLLEAQLGRRGPSPAPACTAHRLSPRLGRRGPSPAPACTAHRLSPRLSRLGPSPAPACAAHATKMTTGPS